MTPLTRAALVVLTATVLLPAAATFAAPGGRLASPSHERPTAATDGSHGIPPTDAGSGALAGPVGRAAGAVTTPKQGASRSGAEAARTGATRPRWRWPLAPRPPVVRPFRAPVSVYGPGHRGLDLGAREGSPVLAVEAGRVTHAGSVAGRGTVTVQHGDGLRSTYEPLAPSVRAGDAVAVGDELGRIAIGSVAPHCGVRVCLHLGALERGVHVDPLPLLVGGRLALLPLG